MTCSLKHFSLLQLFVDSFHFLTAKTRTVSERKHNGRYMPGATDERDDVSSREPDGHASYFRSPYWDTRYTNDDFGPVARYEVDKLTCV